MQNLKNRFTHIFIDADDTLWENESFFRAAEDEFARILAPYADVAGSRQKLWLKQEENIPLFGYGSKTYLIGMLDSAVDLCGGNLPAEVFHALKQVIVDLSFHPLDLVEGVEETLAALSREYTLVLATKGDIIEQLSKVEESGLSGYFLSAEVMQYKSEKDYLALARKFGLRPQDMLMVGNSVRSDIIPVIDIGGTAIHVPHEMVWVHELADMPISDRVVEVEKFKDIVNLLI